MVVPGCTAQDTTFYRIFQVPPGTYRLSEIRQINDHLIHNYLSEKIDILIKPNEVVYVGDYTVSPAKTALGPTISISKNVAAAAAALREFKNIILPGQMQVRLPQPPKHDQD